MVDHLLKKTIFNAPMAKSNANYAANTLCVNAPLQPYFSFYSIHLSEFCSLSNTYVNRYSKSIRKVLLQIYGQIVEIVVS